MDDRERRARDREILANYAIDNGIQLDGHADNDAMRAAIIAAGYELPEGLYQQKNAALLERDRLYALAKQHDLGPHPRHGLAKLQQMLLDAGIEFELADTPSEREADPDLEIPHPGAPKGELEGDDMPEPEKPAPAPAKSQSDMVEVIVMVKNVHVAAVDLGRPASDTSVKLFFKERHKLTRAMAERLAGRGQVEIL